jgi:hypothetical protein
MQNEKSGNTIIVRGKTGVFAVIGMKISGNTHKLFNNYFRNIVRWISNPRNMIIDSEPFG